jgi:hypothetical protein
VAFAKAVLEARGGVSDAQYDAGWTDTNIVEMIALTAQFLLTNLMNIAVQTPIDFPEVSPVKAAYREVPSFGEGRLENPISRRSPRPGVKRVNEPPEASGRHEGARRPRLAARAHGRACQRQRVAEGHRPEHRPQDLVWP